MPVVPVQPSGRRYSVKRVNQRHHLMIRLMMLGLGNKEIATQLGVTPQNVSDVRNSPLVQEKLAFLQTKADVRTLDVMDDLARDAGNNIALLKEVRDGKLTQDVRVRVQVAQDLLDRGGYGKVQKVLRADASLDKDDLDRIKAMAARARERQLASVEAQTVEAEQ
jgi:hypothetical protein